MGTLFVSTWLDLPQQDLFCLNRTVFASTWLSLPQQDCIWFNKTIYPNRSVCQKKTVFSPIWLYWSKYASICPNITFFSQMKLYLTQQKLYMPQIRLHFSFLFQFSRVWHQFALHLVDNLAFPIKGFAE